MSADDVLRRQIEYFRSDELVKERAAPYREMTPAECWAETVSLCEDLDWFYSMMEPEVRARALEPERLPQDIVEILEAMQRQR